MDELQLRILLGALPGFLLLIYIFKKDPQPEPKSRLAKAVLWGALICIPVSLVEVIISHVLFGSGLEPTTTIGATAEAFLVAALPEEGFKLLALWLVLRHNPYFDEHFDGIIYAVCVGLGFATVENVLYLFQFDDEWVSIGISRALLAVPAHYAFGVLMGYYYSLHHFVDHSQRIAVCILLVPALAHGFYDAIALSAAINPAVEGVSMLVLIVFCIYLHKYCKKRIAEQVARDRSTNLDLKNFKF